jgi:hypothetical protein
MRCTSIRCIFLLYSANIGIEKSSFDAHSSLSFSLSGAEERRRRRGGDHPYITMEVDVAADIITSIASHTPQPPVPMMEQPPIVDGDVPGQLESKRDRNTRREGERVLARPISL